MTFMMFVFAITFIIIEQRSLDVTEGATRKQAGEVLNLLKSEVELANLAIDGYAKEFLLPDYINGEEYFVELVDKSELVVSFKNQKQIAFLNANITGSISSNKGYHIIRKNNGVITLGQGRI